MALLPGMTQERWELYLLQRRRAAGEDVTFTPAQIQMLAREAQHLNDRCTPEEIRAIVEAGGF